VCKCCRKRSSRGTQILTRRSQSALGLEILPAWAAENGHLHILEYLVERKYDKYNEDACEYAAENGHLDCLKYLHETAKAPWDYSGRTRSAREQTPRMCTIPPRQQLSLPDGWRYEDGRRPSSGSVLRSSHSHLRAEHTNSSLSSLLMVCVF
jgi:ankyrin repeat protein